MEKLQFHDLPHAWYQQLASHASLESLLALSRTSREVHKLVLSNLDFHCVELRSHPATVPQSASTLCSVLDQSERVFLCLDASQDGDDVQETARSAAAVAILCTAVTLRRAGLAGIRAVHLTCLVLDSLVPSWLITSCFNMRELMLDQCMFTNPPALHASMYPPCPQLERLVWINHGHLDLATAASAQQLRALPSLHSLFLEFDFMQNPMEPVGADAWAPLAAMGGQITELQLKATRPDTQQLVELFPSLRTLDMSPFTLEDEEVNLLLGLPLALSVRSFDLEEDHSQQECHWTQLSMVNVDMADLDRLPLDRIPALRPYAGEHWRTIRPASDPPNTQRIVTTLISRGWLRAPKLDAKLTICAREAPVEHSAECVRAALPLLTAVQCDELQLSHCHVTPDLLADLQLSLCEVTHYSGCQFAPNAWPRLMLAHDVSLQNCGFTDSELIEACVNATGPIKVRFVGVTDWGIKSRIQAAMAGAGHQHVTLVTYDELF